MTSSGAGRWLAACTWMAVLAALAGCNRVTLLRPDTSRGDFRRTAPEVEVRDGPRRVDVYPLVAAGQQQLSAGDTDAAERTARQAIKADPRSPVAQTLLALVHEARNEDAQAGRAYARALALAPNQGAMLNNHGAWLCRNGRAAESLVHFERALADPAYATPTAALANLGACSHLSGDPRSQAALERALQLDPANALALGVMAERLLQQGEGLRARAFSERRLAAAPADARSLRIASQIEDMLGDTRAADAYRRRLRAQFPQNASESDASGQQDGAK